MSKPAPDFHRLMGVLADHEALMTPHDGRGCLHEMDLQQPDGTWLSYTQLPNGQWQSEDGRRWRMIPSTCAMEPVQ